MQAWHSRHVGDPTNSFGEGAQATRPASLCDFFDYSKAFDNVSHVQLFQIMKQMGFHDCQKEFVKDV